MAKAPVPGRVKTRMTPPCTPAEAATIAEAALVDTLEAALASGADRVVLALDGEAGPWLPLGLEVIPQGQGTFATRLRRVWEAVGTPGLQIGMDTPQLTTADLDHALLRLADPAVDALLGPAADGGWWALGLARPCEDPFAGIAMSRPDTGARQHARLIELGLRVEELAVMRDADDFADALAVAAGCPTTRFAAAVDQVSRR
jgi:glycosyltransferase A (GT-A) superfamily protein (DUF2064 family)